MMYEKDLKPQVMIHSVIETLISAISIFVAIYYSRNQIKSQNRMELEPLYEKMLSTIPKENMIMTKSDIFDEGDNLIGTGISTASMNSCNLASFRNSVSCGFNVACVEYQCYL